MKRRQYTPKYKIEAVKKVMERGHRIDEVALRLGISEKSLSRWVKQTRQSGLSPNPGADDIKLRSENTQLKAELKRTTEERDILKKGHGVLCQFVRVRYAFMAGHRIEFMVSSMCRVLKVNRSGYYAWLAKPHSARAVFDAKLLIDIRQSFSNSHGIYDSPRVHCDLRAAGIVCGPNRVARLMRQAKLRSVRGYKRPRYRRGRPAITAPNRLQQKFTVARPDHAWVTDITYFRTYEGWLYLAVVLDLYSRAVVGWAMQPTMTTELALKALMMAVWRRKPTQPVIIHSDQGSQFGSDEFTRWCKDNRLVASMSRRGNCYDNAVVESFFSSLKK